MIFNVPSQRLSPGEPCNICGDVGYQELLATCSKCIIAREHIYCTHIQFPEVPNVWLCESCNTTNLANPCKPPDDTEKSKNIKGPQTFGNSKVKFIPLEEAARATKNLEAVSRRKAPQPKKEIQGIRGAYHRPKAATCVKQINIAAAEHEKQANTKDLAIVSSKPVKDFLHSPTKVAIWKGSFDIAEQIRFGESFFSFCAHPTATIHPKAYLFLKLLPSILRINTCPRFNIWSEMFADQCPDIDDIALYFFPQCNKSRISYVSLLEVMKLQDFVFVTMVASVELVLFSSIHLRKGSRRLSSEHFICGIFRRIPGRENDPIVDEIVLKKTQVLENQIPLKMKLPSRPPGFGVQSPNFRQEPHSPIFSQRQESSSQRRKF